MLRRALLFSLLAGLVACGGDPPPGAEEPTSASGTGGPEGPSPAADGSALSAPAPAPPGWPPWFEEVAEERGLRFQHVSGHGEQYLMPEIMGGGAALFDADDDGDLDAYLVQGGHLQGGQQQPPNQLFLNDGGGRFQDVTPGSGAGHTGYGMGVACGDADADGDVDLYVTNWGPDALLLNEGAGRFADGTGPAGLGQPGWGSSAAFADLDGDGFLDLYVCNYLVWSPESELTCRNFRGQLDYCDPANYHAPAPDVLYRNLGQGRFADVSAESGVGQLARTGLGVVCGDLDEDGRTDVFVANDGMSDLLWRNEGDWRFRDVALVAGCALDTSGQPKAGMGVTLEDVDDDGDLDLLVCNLDKQTDSFYVNEGGVFSDRTARTGLAAASRPFTRFGVGLLDLDHDGLLDLFQANGRVTMGSRSWRADDPYAEPNLVLRGTVGGLLQPLATADGTALPLLGASRAAAFGDVDGDGAVDVLVVNRDGPAHLYRNRAGATAGDDGRHWIGLVLVDERGAPALGATVRFRAGGRQVRRDARAASSYQASNDPRVHVGLGGARAAEAIVVRWPDGHVEAFGDRPADAWHALRRGQGTP